MLLDCLTRTKFQINVLTRHCNSHEEMIGWPKYSQNENPDIDATAARLEWEKMKTTMFEAYRGTTMRKFLQDLAFNNTLKDLFPQLYQDLHQLH